MDVVFITGGRGGKGRGGEGVLERACDEYFGEQAMLARLSALSKMRSSHANIVGQNEGDP